MRQLLSLLFILSLNISGAQTLLEEKLSIDFKNCSVEKCLRILEENTGTPFSYNSKQIGSLNNKVTEKFDEVELSVILDKIFLGTSFRFKEIGKQVTIFEVKSDAGTIVISGFIRDKASREEIIGARVYFPNHGVGCIANSYGYYAIEIPKGETPLYVVSVGMLRIQDNIDADEDMVLNFDMYEDTVVLSTVEVLADSLKTGKIENDLPYLDKTVITKQALSKIPAVNGETDVVKFLMQFPGVTPSTEGGANYQVRGSGTGNNLILLDEIPIYHPTHLLGLYSIINSDALKSATLYKDHIPLQFGSRNSSVLQVHTKEGNLTRHELSGSLGFISTRLNWEGPIVKNKASFYISGRRSAFPAIAGQFLRDQELSLPRFFDINAKVNIHLNSNNRIYFTGYTGLDKLSDSVSTYDWGNTAAAFRWNHIFNGKTFANISIIHSEFEYGYVVNTGFELDNFRQKVVTDKVGIDVTNFFSSSLKFTYGFSATWLRTRYGAGSAQQGTLFLQRNAFENAAYISVEKKFSNKLKLEGGIRVPFSFHIGTQDTTSYLKSDFMTIPVIYDQGKFYDPLFYVDPRALLTYRLSEKSQIQFSAGIVSQHTHIINYVNYFLPVEIWTTSNKYLKPERNFQTSFGWVRTGKKFNISLTAFTKYVRNVLDYASPIFISSADIESNLLSGFMLAAGAETMFNFHFGEKYSITASYTYTASNQRIVGINNDKAYPTMNFRPHYMAISQYLNLSKKWQLSSNFTWHSGKAVTLPNGQFVIDGTAFPIYDNTRNSERLPFFSRWDISVLRKFGWKKKRERLNLTMSITNITGRFNPAVVYIQPYTYEPSQLNMIGEGLYTLYDLFFTEF